MSQCGSHAGLPALCPRASPQGRGRCRPAPPPQSHALLWVGAEQAPRNTALRPRCSCSEWCAAHAQSCRSARCGWLPGASSTSGPGSQVPQWERRDLQRDTISAGRAREGARGCAASVRGARPEPRSRPAQILSEYDTLATPVGGKGPPLHLPAYKHAGALATVPVDAWRRRQGQSQRLASIRAASIRSGVGEKTPWRMAGNCSRAASSQGWR